MATPEVDGGTTGNWQTSQTEKRLQKIILDSIRWSLILSTSYVGFQALMGYPQSIVPGK